MGWISVKERLPEVGQPVVACRKFNEDEIRDMSDVECLYFYGCCIYKSFGFPWVQFSNPNPPITHWMPLIPPKELP